MIEALQRVRLVVTDVDGVLTSGVIPIDAEGRRMGFFSARDGMGVALARAAGLDIAVLSGAVSGALRGRAAELGIRHVYEGARDKALGIDMILRDTGHSRAETLYVGDDLNDLPAFRSVGVAVAVADAVPELRARAHWVTRAAGGAGALREIIDAVLRSQGTWERTVEALFGASGAGAEV